MANREPADFGTAIRSRRKRLGYSQEDLAFRSGLHRTYLADIERGRRNPSLLSIAKLAKALEVSISELFTNPRSKHAFAGRAQGKRMEHVKWDGRLVEVLLVEDSDADAELAIRALQDCNIGNQIHWVKDGSSALNFIFRSGQYADRKPVSGSLVVLLDLNLPGMGGLEVLKRVRSDRRSSMIPVVILTVSRDSKDIVESRRLGAEDYIVKPVDFEQFGVTMTRMGFRWLLLDKTPT